MEITKNQATRLEEIFSKLGEDPKGKKCTRNRRLGEKGGEVLGEDMDDDVRDAALIATAPRVEHYEDGWRWHGSYLCHHLGEDDAAGVLEEILNEEKEADTQLTSAEEINVEADSGAEGDEVETPANRGRKTGGRGSSAALVLKAECRKSRRREFYASKSTLSLPGSLNCT